MLAYGIALLTLQAINIKVQIESWPSLKADVLGAENRSLLNMIHNPAHGLRPDGEPILRSKLFIGYANTPYARNPVSVHCHRSKPRVYKQIVNGWQCCSNEVRRTRVHLLNYIFCTGLIHRMAFTTISGTSRRGRRHHVLPKATVAAVQSTKSLPGCAKYCTVHAAWIARIVVAYWSRPCTQAPFECTNRLSRGLYSQLIAVAFYRHLRCIIERASIGHSRSYFRPCTFRHFVEILSVLLTYDISGRF